MLLAVVPARAETGPEPVRFAWVRGDGADRCASQQQIAEQVTARLGKSPFAADASRSIEAIVTGSARRLKARIFVRGKDGALLGSRELTSEAADCASLEAASVLAIALAIDPEAAMRPPAPPPRPPPPPPVVRLPATPPPLPALPLPPAEPMAAPLPAALAPPVIEREGLGNSGIALRGGAGFGLLPGPAPAVSLAAHVGVARPVQITAEAMWLPETRTSDARFGFGLAALSLGACFVPVRAPAVDLAACAAVWGGAIHAVVYDLQPAAPGDYGWAAASATPRLRVRLGGRLHAEVGAHLIVPINRRSFAVRGWADPVFQQAPVTVLTFAGLGVHFP